MDDLQNLVYLIIWGVMFLITIIMFLRYKKRRAENNDPISWRYEILHVLGIIFLPVVEFFVLLAGFDVIADKKREGFHPNYTPYYNNDTENIKHHHHSHKDFD